MAFEKPVVVLDCGSYNMKAGFSCDNHPVSIFRTVVGRPSYLNGSYGRQIYDVHIGDAAMENIDDLELSHPVVGGKIVHWDNMERVWHHCFYRELKAAPEDRSVLLTCAAATPMKEKVKCCEVFFEALNSPALCIQPQAVLALYGSGYTTGLSIDLGFDSTDINPVYEGGLIKYAHMQTNIHGKVLTNYLKLKLTERNVDLGPRPDDVLEDIKKHFYVSKTFVCRKDTYEKKYTLPSGEVIDVGAECHLAGEMLFQPDLIAGQKTDYLSLQQAIITSSLKCDPDLRIELFEAVIPWGSLGVMPGLNERLGFEIKELYDKPVNMVNNLEPYTLAWLGGATFAGLTEAHKIWVSKKQYEDYGEKIIRNKFL